MYSVFGCPGTLLLIIIIIIIIVRYCFLWLLCGRERFVQYCFLWRSCADAGCHVYVPWVYHLAANRVVRTSAFGCLNWAGSISFVRTFLRGYLWASPFFFCFFFFVDVGNRTNVFFVQEHILAKFGALRARSFNSRDRSL